MIGVNAHHARVQVTRAEKFVVNAMALAGCLSGASHSLSLPEVQVGVATNALSDALYQASPLNSRCAALYGTR